MGGIIKRGGGGVLQRKDSEGRYGGKATSPERDEVEVREASKPPENVPLSKLPTQANRESRGPEVVG